LNRFGTSIRIPGGIDGGDAEAPLFRDTSLLLAIIDGLTEQIYVKDTECRFIFANRATALAMGVATPEELIGKTDLDFYPEEYAARYVYEEREIIQSGASLKEIEAASVDPTGRPVWQLNTKVPLRDEAGTIVGLVGITIDITEIREYEEALANERRLLRTIVDLIPDWIYAKDTKSRFIFGNVAVAQNAGFDSPEELVGKTDFDLAPEELASQYFVDEQELMTSGEGFRDKVEPGIYPDGEVKWVLSTKVPLRDSEGRVIGLAGLGRDVTERTRTEEAIRRYQERLEEEVAHRTAELRDANARLEREIAERD
jgi:PAS domain S-box-containing protein